MPASSAATAEDAGHEGHRVLLGMRTVGRRTDLPPELSDVVFAVRPYGPDGHYYANFGYYCYDPEAKGLPDRRATLPA